jgi:hypothetical protein
MIGGLGAAGAGHKLDHDGRISRHMLFEIIRHRPRAHLADAAGRTAANDGDGFPLIERRLRINGWRRKEELTRNSTP